MDVMRKGCFNMVLHFFILKYMDRIILTILLVFISCPVFPQPQNPILDWESLPVIRNGVKIKAYSSTNPTGRTMRDFRNHTLVSEAGHEMIRMYQDRGMLVQLWFTSLGGGDSRFGPGRFGRVNLYLDNEASPDYVKDRGQYFRRPSLTFPRPLWDSDGPAQWAFPCLPFRDFFMVSSSQNPHWFQVTTHLYRDEPYDESIPNDLLYQINNRLQDYRGRFPGVERGNRVTDEALRVEPGSTRELFNRNSGGVIRTISMIPATINNAVIDEVWVRVDYGGVEPGAIEVPMTVFFGGYTGAPITNALGMPAGYDGRELYFHFPMPFWEGCTISLINRSAEVFETDYRVRYSDRNTYQRGNTGKLYIQYNNNITVEAGKPDFVHLGKEGSGTIVGTTANLAGSIEGNFRLYVDDMKTPAFETTGGEDYFCHAFGIDVGLCTPFHGGLYDKIGYRFHIIDYIPFLSSVQLTQDHGHEYMHDTEGTFRSAVFYYRNRDAKIELTDEFDVGVRGQERRHGYSLTGAGSVQEDEGRYEGNFNEVFSDGGVWFDRSLEFTAKIYPGNSGVRLRRRINQKSFHQLVEVYVDGEYAGRWFEQGSNYELLKEPDPENFPEYTPGWTEIDAIWRDTEFEIPAALTVNKKEIRVELRHVSARSAVEKVEGEAREAPGTGNEVEDGSGYRAQPAAARSNAYYFWVYSYEE